MQQVFTLRVSFVFLALGVTQNSVRASSTMVKAESSKKSSKEKVDKPEKKSKKDKSEGKNGVVKKSSKKKDTAATEVAAVVAQLVDEKVKSSSKRERGDGDVEKKKKKVKVQEDAPAATPASPEKKEVRRLATGFSGNTAFKEAPHVHQPSLYHCQLSLFVI